MNQEMNAKELEAKLKAQERITQPLHPEDVPLFLRESVEVKRADGQERQEMNRE